MTIEDLFQFLALSGVINTWVSLAISLLTLFFFLSTKLLNPARATSYCAFLFCGLAEAHLQLMIYSNVHGDEILVQFWVTLVHVTSIGLLGILTSIKSLGQDMLLRVLVGMTLLLGALTAGSIGVFPPNSLIGVLSSLYLDLYARFYALICIIAPALVTLYLWRSRK